MCAGYTKGSKMSCRSIYLRIHYGDFQIYSGIDFIKKL